MTLPILPRCRHRGLEILPGQWTCRSPKLITPGGLVEAEVCQTECPYVDHDEDHAALEALNNTLLGSLTIRPRAFESAPIEISTEPQLLSIAMITAPRPVRTIERSIQELRRAGFPQPIHVFAEPGSRVPQAAGLKIENNPNRRGLWGNWRHAASRLLEQTQTPFLLITEDDIQLAKGAANALQYAMETCSLEDWGYVSLYTPFHNVRNQTVQLGWQALDLGLKAWGALAYCFSRESLEALLNSEIVRNHTGARDTDAVVSLAYQQLGRKCWFHVPSLCAHTGTGISSMHHEGREEFYAIGFRGDFSQYCDKLPPEMEEGRTATFPRISLEDSPPRIPKIIHQVWIGDHPPPNDCLASWQRNHPDWEYRLWTEQNIEFPLRNQHLFDATPNFSGKVNLLRYEILEKYGGIYIDADMLCLKPLPADIICHRLVSVYEDELGSPGLINNCFLGAPAGSPILRALIDELGLRTPEEVSRIASWKITGPKALTNIVQGVLGREDVKIFPSRFFIPIHFSRNHGPAGALDEAYAVHLFGSTANIADELEALRKTFLIGGARPIHRQKKNRLKDLTVLVQSSYLPACPSTEMIQRSWASLSRLGEGFRVVTCFDGFPGPVDRHDDYAHYKRQVKKLLPGEFCELTEWKHSGGSLAAALDLVKTPFLFYWEHDWELVKEIDLEGVLAALEHLDDVRFIRLNKRRNETAASDRELRQRPGMSPVPLVITPSWSANPHFAATSTYRKIVLPKSQAGVYLEEPLFQEAQADYRRLGLAAQYAKWGLCIFGRLGDSAAVRHLDGKFFSSTPHSQSQFPSCDCPWDSSCDCTAIHSYESCYRVVLQTRKPKHVIEWGPGLNTQLAVQAEAAVTSFEFSKRWLPTFNHPRLHVRHTPVDSADWIDLRQVAPADLYFIDSRRRADCLRAVFDTAKPAAVVCLHDAQRRRYHEALALFPHVWFAEPGFALASQRPEPLQEIREALREA